MGANSRHWWARFRAWRRSRPLAGGLCTLAAGVVILVPPYAALQIGQVSIAVQTLGGSAALVIGLTLCACGLAMWTRPAGQFAPWLTLVLALVAVPAANLGSLLIGSSLGLLGFALAMAWTPTPAPAPEPEPAPAPHQPEVDAGPAELTKPIPAVGAHR